VIVEPLERSLYDTRTFSLAVKAQVQQDRAPVILHGLGKDAKAIKFMVNYDCDRVPWMNLADSSLPTFGAVSTSDWRR
ncbi:hypothetical protein, partial [Klebsiella quasipneumoniae]|uniref:hypothetical protein n=1 Tax=Klebsiella quasipneumoniae TaxID=1463165 RepID=UPI0027312644